MPPEAEFQYAAKEGVQKFQVCACRRKHSTTMMPEGTTGREAPPASAARTPWADQSARQRRGHKAIPEVRQAQGGRDVAPLEAGRRAKNNEARLARRVRALLSRRMRALLPRGIGQLLPRRMRALLPRRIGALLTRKIGARLSRRVRALPTRRVQPQAPTQRVVRLT